MLCHPCILRIPNMGEKHQKWLPHPCLVGGPKEGGNAPSSLHSRGPQQKGTKSEVDTSPLPSRGPKRGRKCYVALAFSGIPNAKCREQNQKWAPTKGNRIKKACRTAAFSGVQNRAQMLRHPCILGGPKEGGNATSPLHSGGSPTPSVGSKIRNDPQQRGTKSAVDVPPLPSRGQKEDGNAAPPLHSRGSPKRGKKCRCGYVNAAFSGSHNRAEMLPHPCILGGPQEGKNAMAPLHSRRFRTKGNKIRSGYLTPAFSGAQKRAEMLRHPCISGIPNAKHGEQN